MARLPHVFLFHSFKHYYILSFWQRDYPGLISNKMSRGRHCLLLVHQLYSGLSGTHRYSYHHRNNNSWKSSPLHCSDSSFVLCLSSLLATMLCLCSFHKLKDMPLLLDFLIRTVISWRLLLVGLISQSALLPLSQFIWRNVTLFFSSTRFIECVQCCKTWSYRGMRFLFDFMLARHGLNSTSKSGSHLHRVIHVHIYLYKPATVAAN